LTPWIDLDEVRSGAFYLRQPAVADMIVEALQSNADIFGHYALHAFVVMPNQRSFASHSSRGIAPTDEVTERHNRQAGQRDVGIDGKALLAGREL